MTSVIAIVVVAAMALTGTFAWSSLSQQALNQAVVQPWVAGGRLHDRFEDMGANFGEGQWAANTTANKEVFVENFSDRIDADRPGQDIFVRVRLHEFLEMGPGANLPPTDPGFAARTAEPVVAGTTRENFQAWPFRTPTGNSSGQPEFEYYWTWNFGEMGDQVWYMPTFNIDPDSVESDVSGAAVDPQAGGVAAEPTNPTARNNNANIDTPADPDYRTGGYPAEAGNEGFWGEDDVWTARQKQAGNTLSTYDVEQETAQNIQLAHPVITMQEWLNGDAPLTAPRQTGNFWIWDVDGWFYWASPLPAGEASGLLLDSITLNGTPNVEMYYAIFVDAEMATANYWNHATHGFTGTLTDGAEILLSLIAPNSNMGAPVDPGDIDAIRAIIRATDVGETFTANAIEWRVVRTVGNYRLILTEYVHGNVPYNADGIWTPLSQSDLRGHLDAWGEANLTPALRAIAAVPLNVDTDVRNAPGGAVAPFTSVGLESGDHGGFTSPGALATPLLAPQALFIFSQSEVNEMAAPGVFNVNSILGSAGNPYREAFRPGIDGLVAHWWTRSPSSNPDPEGDQGRIVLGNTTGSSGAFNNSPTNVNRGMRPALWVQVDLSGP